MADPADHNPNPDPNPNLDSDPNPNPSSAPAAPVPHPDQEATHTHTHTNTHTQDEEAPVSVSDPVTMPLPENGFTMQMEGQTHTHTHGERFMDGDMKPEERFDGMHASDPMSGPGEVSASEVVEEAFEALIRADSGRKRMEMISNLALTLGIDELEVVSLDARRVEMKIIAARTYTCVMMCVDQSCSVYQRLVHVYEAWRLLQMAITNTSPEASKQMFPNASGRGIPAHPNSHTNEHTITHTKESGPDEAPDNDTNESGDGHRSKRRKNADSAAAADADRMLLAPRWLTIGRTNFQMFFCAATPLGDDHLRAAHTQLVQDCLSRHKVLCSLCMSPYPILFGSSGTMSVTYEIGEMGSHFSIAPWERSASLLLESVTGDVVEMPKPFMGSPM